ncbi:MAG: DrmB family protein [Pseudomonadota bacterium]
MPRFDLGKLRRSSLLMTFGPGAIVDFRAEGAPVSAVVMGLDDWDRDPPAGLSHPQVISEERLERQLQVKGFRLPPVKDPSNPKENEDSDRNTLRARQFPEWLQCPQCDQVGHSMDWGQEPGKSGRYCPQCTRPYQKAWVIPVRFVVSCANGHLEDFPWHEWVGHKEGCKRPKKLRLRSERPGLAGLKLSCPACKAVNSMDGVFSASAIRRPCRGRQPWLPGNPIPKENCTQSVRVLQRGASNIYYPVTASALSIPPWSDRLQEALGTNWSDIVSIEDAADRSLFLRVVAKNRLSPVLAELNMSVAELEKEIERRVALVDAVRTLGIRGEEFRELSEKVPPSYPHPEFEVRHEPVPASLSDYLAANARVVRLREVRALTGFTRVDPPSGDRARVARISVENKDWLPAIEVRGEGIFLSLDESRLQRWEEREDVLDRARLLAGASKQHPDLPATEYASPDLPRFVVIHTLAHVLIRQLSLECGYSSSSLRERLYVRGGDNPMAGLLIYTATPDSDGTLGGLQRQGRTSSVERILRNALQSACWCSSDPLCFEGGAVLANTSNLAACHSCALAPETACEMFNSFLDRAVLVGTPGNREMGFFSGLVGEN